MRTLDLIPRSEFERVRSLPIDPHAALGIIADMCRFNALTAVKKAGSGHLGSSFSAMDIVVWLYYRGMNAIGLGLDNPNRDVYFSSKGHDVPAQYAVLFSLGVIPEEKLLKLRRFGGLDGHSDLDTLGIEANSGSLGMGISKAEGMAWAKRHKGLGGHVYVMVGDGELQEGQIYEALHSAAQHGLNNLTVIVDHNKVQSDKLVDEIVSLGNLEAKFRSFGWNVGRCDGHDLVALEGSLKRLMEPMDGPQVLLADTIKGKGVSFMEHPRAMKEGKGYYPWHSGAPADEPYLEACDELRRRIDAQLVEHGSHPVQPMVVPYEKYKDEDGDAIRNALGEPVSLAARKRYLRDVAAEYVADAYGETLVDLASERPDLVVLDSDLAADCRVRKFEETFPERFIEMGIAEQAMVSTAGGLARFGLLPVVNSFASFLASRANEQIYNNATEGARIIYACHYAGLLPAGPGKSHQSVRDISLLGAIPNIIVIQPCNAEETRRATRYCVLEAKESCVLRLIIGPSPSVIVLPDNYEFRWGCGTVVERGQDGVIIAYGPVMLHEALIARKILRDHGMDVSVMSMPWLNRIDATWMEESLAGYSKIYVMEDHSVVGGFSDALSRTMGGSFAKRGMRIGTFGVEGFPVFGHPQEALAYHRLDGVTISERILRDEDAWDG